VGARPVARPQVRQLPQAPRSEATIGRPAGEEIAGHRFASVAALGLPLVSRIDGPLSSEVDPIDWTIFRGLIFAPEAAPISRDFT
jgi:hypothetical protein